MNLQNWISQARAHWEEFLPEKFASLQEAGTLQRALKEAAEQTHREMTALEEQGFRNHEAWEMVREKYLFLPAETDEDEYDFSDRPIMQLMQDVARLRHHTNMVIANPDYEVPDIDSEEWKRT